MTLEARSLADRAPASPGIFRSIAPLVAAVCVISAGHGLLTTKTSLDLNARDVGAATLGIVLSGFPVGFLLGCLVSRRVVASFGHVRAFQFMAIVTALAMPIFLLSTNSWLWLGLRVVNGCAMAVIFTIVESWINLVASRERRGALFSIYMVLNGFGLAAGQAAINVGDPAGNAAYFFACAMSLFAVTPLAFAASTGPTAPSSAETTPQPNKGFGFMQSLRVIPLAVLGTLQAGLTNICFGSMGPIYAIRTGHGAGEAAALVTAFSVGGTLAQIPLGWLSDRFDRRLMLGAIAGAAAASCLAIVTFGQMSLPVLLFLAMIYGAATLCIYPLAIAFAGSQVPRPYIVAMSGQLLFVYSLGAIVSPSITNFLMTSIAPSALFAFLGSGAALVALAGLASYLVAGRAERTA